MKDQLSNMPIDADKKDFLINKIIKDLIFKNIEDFKNYETKLTSSKFLNNKIVVNPIELQMNRYSYEILMVSNSSRIMTMKFEHLKYYFKEKYGFNMPEILITMDSKLKNDMYSILINGNVATIGELPLSKYLVNGFDLDSAHNDSVLRRDIKYNFFAQWITKEELAKNSRSINYFMPIDILCFLLQMYILKFIDSIFSANDVRALIESNPECAQAAEFLIPDKISVFKLRRILANMLEERLPIKNLNLILERLCEYCEESRNTEFLYEKIREDFKDEICLANVGDERVLYALSLSQELQSNLMNLLADNKFTDNYIPHIPVLKSMIHDISTVLLKEQQESIKPIVLICHSKIRYQLHKLLEKYDLILPVISYLEISPVVKLEIIKMLDV